MPDRDQGEYHDPECSYADGRRKIEGFITDIITNMSLDWLLRRDTSQRFALIVHHRAPHPS